MTLLGTMQLSTLSGSSRWTIEAWVWPENFLAGAQEVYLFDTRSSGNQSTGFAVGFYRSNQTNRWARPSVYSEGGTARLGPIAPAFATTANATAPMRQWTHVAWVADPNYANTVFFFINGSPAGSVSVGTNFNTTSAWESINIGRLNAGPLSFPFVGKIAHLKISASS